MEHPDITSACRDGRPTWQQGSRDCPELRKFYIDECSSELLAWIQDKHPDLVEDWLEESDYPAWLEDMT